MPETGTMLSALPNFHTGNLATISTLRISYKLEFIVPEPLYEDFLKGNSLASKYSGT